MNPVSIKLSLWQRLRYRLGIYTFTEVINLIKTAFDDGYDHGFEQGGLEASSKLSNVLADVAQERLNKILEKDKIK